MRVLLGVRVQAFLVVALFLAALATLLFTSASAWLIPQREVQIRDSVRAAALRLAEAVRKAVPESKPLSLDLHNELAAVTAKTLVDFPGIEGGFFLAEEVGRFAGFAFPTDPHPPPDRKGKARRDPPPKEKQYVEDMVRESLTRPAGQPLVRSFDVGPVGNRIVVATEPVGSTRPARLVVWVMMRVHSLDPQFDQANRYRLSVGLALGGILLALVLTANLGWSLRRERSQREQLREELRRAEHLASLGRMLAGVAHEVRNPLAGIRSSLQLWQRLPDLARNSAPLEAVLRAVDRLDGLVSRLLYFARGGQDDRHPVDLNGVVGEALELVRAQAVELEVIVEADLTPHLPRVAGSPQALQQVVLNLFANALQAMSDGRGKSSPDNLSRKDKRQNCLRCRTRFLPASNRIELLVSDTGPGVPPAARPHLFEPFFTTRPEGTGLGLALCREIVQQHGGTIELLDPGPGAVFGILLPSIAPT